MRPPLVVSGLGLGNTIHYILIIDVLTSVLWCTIKIFLVHFHLFLVQDPFSAHVRRHNCLWTISEKGDNNHLKLIQLQAEDNGEYNFEVQFCRREDHARNLFRVLLLTYIDQNGDLQYLRAELHS